MIEHLSYSSIRKYLACQKNWKFKYIDKLETTSSDALLFGSAWHKMIGLVCAGDNLDHAWTKSLSEITQEKTDGEYAELAGDGMRMITVPEVITTIQGLQPKELEYKFEIGVPGVDVPVIGFIDMIDQDGAPVDFKTAGRKWSQQKADDDLQPTFYLMAMQQLGLVSLPATFRYMIFTKTKNPEVQIIDTVRTAKDILNLHSLIREVYEAMQKDFFLPTGLGSWLCSEKYCDFWSACQYGGA